MPRVTKNRKFYLRAPDLEFRLNGPIKIGNVITDMTLPQDPITFLDPLPKTIAGSGYNQGKTEMDHDVSVNAGLSTKLYDVFGGQAEAKISRSLKTIYAFDKVSAWYLERNPTPADAKSFRERDDEFKTALRNGPVSIVTGFGGAHVTQDVTLKAKLAGEVTEGNNDSWTVLGDTILANRLHVVKREGWLWKGDDKLIAKTFDPGNAGFMKRDDEVDEFKVDTNEMSQEDVSFFAAEQEFEGVDYVDFEDEEEDWSLAVLLE